MRKPDYGIDSPGMVYGQLALGALAVTAAFARPHLFGIQPAWIVEGALGLYFLNGALGMLHYSKSAKLKMREMLLDTVNWRGDELVLDVGCGRGLLLAGAARRLTTGKATGADVWLPKAVTGNSPEAVMQNAACEGVSDRVELKRADARELPFAAATFDVVVSNFVLHEVDTKADRERMLQEMVRVLKPGGRLALIDFIFTGEAVETLRRTGLTGASRLRIDWLSFRVAAVLLLGAFQPFLVTAAKNTPASYLENGGPGAEAQKAQR